MKKKIIILIFNILCNSYAQSISSSSNTPNVNISSRSEPACAVQSIPGMQYSKTVHYVYKGYLFDKAINLQGTVNNVVESEAFVLDSFSIEPKSKIIQLKSVTIETRHDYDSSMVSAFDSNFVYVPYDSSIQVGDGIFIKNYSSIFFGYCNEAGDFINSPKGYVSGEIEITRPSSTHIIRLRKPNQEKNKEPRNRDASGKFLNRKPSKIIRY